MDDYKSFQEFRKMNTRKKEKYLRRLAHETGVVESIEARKVFTADGFEVCFGTEPVLRHIPLNMVMALEDDEPSVPNAAYCVIRMFEYAPVIEVDWRYAFGCDDDWDGLRLDLIWRALDRVPLKEGEDAPVSHLALVTLLDAAWDAQALREERLREWTVGGLNGNCGEGDDPDA